MSLDPVFANVERYVSALFAPEDAALAGVEQTLLDAGMPQIGVAPPEGKLLHLLARLSGARNILEIGTLGAYSTIWMARALPAGGRLISIEANPDYAAVAKANLTRAGVQDRVSVRIGKGLDELPRIAAEGLGPFDMIFIDADKPPYVEYFEWALRLSRPGTLIVADNVIREGAVMDPDSTDKMVIGARRFNAHLAAETRVSAVVLQTAGAKGHDGMALAVVL